MKRLLLAMLVLAMCVTDSHAYVRSYATKAAFVKKHACPSTGKHTISCAGYVIDDIVPLDCGGKDIVSNKQWQTIAAGKAKDKYERNGPNCKHRTHGQAAQSQGVTRVQENRFHVPVGLAVI